MKVTACAVASLAMASACLADAPAERSEFTRVAMAVPVRIVLYAPDQVTAERAADAAFERIDALDAILSDYNPESELRRMCDKAAAEPVRVSDDLWRVLERSAEVSEASCGAFDVTVGPVVRLWRQARATQRMPKALRLRDALALVDYRLVVMDPDAQTVRLLREDMRIDVGGIAKGYVVDKALRTLADSGVTCALVDAGGDIAVAGAPPGTGGWRVAVPGLGDTTQVEETLELVDMAVATSGDRWQFVVLDGKRYSHIVDPRTGMGVLGPRQVTVVAPDGMTADAWASALSVLEPEFGLKLLEDEPEVAARIVLMEDEDNEMVYESAGWSRLEKRGAV